MTGVTSEVVAEDTFREPLPQLCLEKVRKGREAHTYPDDEEEEDENARFIKQ